MGLNAKTKRIPVEPEIDDREQSMARRPVIIALACAGAMAGIGGLAALRRLVPALSPTSGALAARRRAQPHIEQADAESLAGIEPNLKPLVAFFEAAKDHADAFAADVLGWSGKYQLIRGQHEEFLADAFRKHFFGPDELKQAMTGAVQSYLTDLEAIDNEMLVDIRMDVADLPAGATLGAMPVPDLKERYRTARDRIAGITTADAAVDVGRVAADMIVTAVVTMMAARLGTSAAVVGAGAASSWWTFGIGLVVGVIVDQIIAQVWDWTYDPRGKLVALVKAKIDEVRKLVLDGDAGQPGLRAELRRYADRRAIARREAVLALLADTSGDDGS